MTYPCAHQHCTDEATTRVRLRDDSGVLGYADVCNEHAREIETAAKKVAPTAKITCGGYIRVNEDGKEINQGSIH
jgi:hypothetical protein